MLTRFKKCMYVLTNKDFVEGPAASSMVGELAKDVQERMGERAWLMREKIEMGEVEF